jgi:hypothetical protein
MHSEALRVPSFYRDAPAVRQVVHYQPFLHQLHQLQLDLMFFTPCQAWFLPHLQLHNPSLEFWICNEGPSVTKVTNQHWILAHQFVKQTSHIAEIQLCTPPPPLKLHGDCLELFQMDQQLLDSCQSIASNEIKSIFNAIIIPSGNYNWKL